MNANTALFDGDPIRHEVSNSKRYKAAVRGLDGKDVRVYSANVPGICSYGFQHWFDKERNDWGQIDLINPLYLVHAIEELTEDEAKAVDRMFNLERTKAELIEGFRELVAVFNNEDACFDKVAPQRMPPEHYRFIVNLIKADFDNLDDARLHKLCKEFDATFLAGDYGYSAAQNLAINRIVDLVAQMEG